MATPLALEARTEAVLARLRAALRTAGLDAVCCMSPENFGYAAGVLVPSQSTVRTRLTMALVTTDPGLDLAVVDVEESLVKSAVPGARIHGYNEFDSPPVAALERLLGERGLERGRVGLELGYLPVDAYRYLVRSLPHAVFEPVDAMLAQLRQVKVEAELERIRQVGRAAEAAFHDAMAQVRPGMTEEDLGELVSQAYRRRGGVRLTMLVVGAGERSGHANAVPTRRLLAGGDVIRVDVIGTDGLYCSDVARSAVLGEPPVEVARAFDTLRAAHETALAAIRSGVRSQPIYAHYRERMQAAGLPVINFLGHGLGLTLHEEPYVGRYGDAVLATDMALCIEPLVWFPGRWGLQFEDEVIVRPDGVERITGRSGTQLFTVPFGGGDVA